MRMEVKDSLKSAEVSWGHVCGLGQVLAEGGQPRDESLLVTHLGGDHQGAQGHQVQLGLPDIVTTHEQVQVPGNRMEMGF